MPGGKLCLVAPPRGLRRQQRYQKCRYSSLTWTLHLPVESRGSLAGYNLSDPKASEPHQEIKLVQHRLLKNRLLQGSVAHSLAAGPEIARAA